MGAAGAETAAGRLDDMAVDGRARLAECYEAMGRVREAKYWHGRAVEENPGVRLSSEEALRRIGDLPVEHLLITD